MVDLNFDIVSYCNLNCCCCGHFSPIAEKTIMPLNVFKSDCKRLAVLTGGKIGKFVLLGGEPLLHPDIEVFMQYAYSLFVAEFSIDTNGILLDKMPLSFWNSCKKYNFTINITRYPLNINYKLLVEIGLSHEVKVNIIGFSNGKEPRKWFHNYRDVNGMQNIRENFIKCQWHNKCMNIYYGKTATCVLPLLIHHYNKEYGDTFLVNNNDYIDIYKVNSLEELIEKISKPIPFCRYCLPGTEQEIKWQKSNKNKSEWI